MIELDRAICSQFENSSSREWLETNGIGGYASSSVSGANTRRYHGLLVAATDPPLGRMVLLSKFEESLTIDGEQFDLSCNQYPGKIHGEGYKYLTRFCLDPFPIWTYEINGIEIEKSIFMVAGENSTAIQWKVTNRDAFVNSRFELEVKPLIAFRDHHHLRHEDDAFDGAFVESEGKVSVQPYTEMPQLHIAHNAASVSPQGHWYRDLEYALEAERGFDHREDLFQPFSLIFDLSRDAVVIASTGDQDTVPYDELRSCEMKRRAMLIAKSGAKDTFAQQLVLAADQFIVSRGSGKTIIAGYHWFSDWGRDTMIALNGLTLATNRPEVAKSIISEFSKYISKGMLPNRFPDAGETPDYNTVDATLWFFEAIRAYAEKTEDLDFVRGELYDKLVDIIECHIDGTRFNIHVDTDGLLFAGENGVQLTWMDAKIGDWVVTPRTGKPVEIQALWYNALCITAGFASCFGDKARHRQYTDMAEMAKASFNGQFWNPVENCLFDVVNSKEKDAAVRPNQILTVSLTHTMLGADRARKVVDKIEKELLTPFGLRSLSPNDPKYIPIYTGSPLDRDGSYHQGTVWGWLIGPFVEAYRKVHSKDAIADARIKQILEGFRKHISESMVGQISEIFDGEHPHKARGAAAQAWSVAELLRAIYVQ